MNYQIVKLSNGEDIICNVEKNIDGTLQISAPLKMETYNRSTDKGVVESFTMKPGEMWFINTGWAHRVIAGKNSRRSAIFGFDYKDYQGEAELLVK